MKKLRYAGVLASCLLTAGLFALIIAAPAKLSASSPDEPLSRRTIVLCVAAFIGLHAYKSRTSPEAAAHTI